MPDYWKNLARVDPAALLRQVRREQAERNLPEFIRQAWPVIEPGTTFIDNWHIDCIGEYLEAVNRGQITRLIVNMPHEVPGNYSVLSGLDVGKTPGTAIHKG